MLSPADLARMDLPALRAERRRAQDLALLEDRHRRLSLEIGVPPDCRETTRLVQAAEAEAEHWAAQEGLIALAIRFAADEGSGRPEPVKSGSASPGPSGHGLIARAARALAALTGAPARKTGEAA